MSDDLLARQERAARFHRFLHEEGFDEEIQAWEQSLIDKLVALGVNQDIERFRLQTCIIMCRDFRKWLNKAVIDGEFTKPQLKEIAGGKRSFF